MNTPVYLIFLLVMGIVGLVKGSADTGTFYIFLAAAALGAIPWYFGTRDHTKPASFIEKSLATVWVWFRRLMGLTVGGACIVGGLFTAASTTSLQALSNLLGGLGLVAFGVFVLYVGFFGQGHKEHDFRDDLRLHAKNKRRYGWWF